MVLNNIPVERVWEGFQPTSNGLWEFIVHPYLDRTRYKWFKSFENSDNVYELATRIMDRRRLSFGLLPLGSSVPATMETILEMSASAREHGRQNIDVANLLMWDIMSDRHGGDNKDAIIRANKHYGFGRKWLNISFDLASMYDAVATVVKEYYEDDVL